MSKRREDTRPHGINFTDADWEQIKKSAEMSGWTPSYWVNFTMGWFYNSIGVKWEGLEQHGGKREGAGRKRKPHEPQKDGGQNT